MDESGFILMQRGENASHVKGTVRAKTLTESDILSEG